ncbi:MAG: altronate dehydratase family protein [Desulfovibrio sp.]|nr:altronate dehydratase family protein [Desulfovibrio sp.]
MSEKNPVIRLNEKDNVVVARIDLPKGTRIGINNIVTVTEIPSGHKIAVSDIPENGAVFKYGTEIAQASKAIRPGEHVHKHNVHTEEAEKDYAPCSEYEETRLVPKEQRPTFNGFVRPNGKVGTRNYIGIFTTVLCSAPVVHKICAHFTPEVMKRWPNVDGVVPFITETGCGMEQSGPPMDILRRCTGNYIKHPNIGGALIVGLGCERNNIDAFMEREGISETDRIKRLVIQEHRGSKQSIADGIDTVKQFMELANQDVRRPASVEHLTVALQCGGSDGFSGVSSNPALGLAMDKLIKNGGSCVLAESTEIFGGETVLTKRAATPELAQKVIDIMEWWRQYSVGAAVQFTGSTVPGNLKGGLTSTAEKALGVVRKAGNTGMVDVVDYGFPVTKPGFTYMDTPARDSVSVTGEISGGCNLVAFTTGRGTCLATYPAPTMKFCSNTPAFNNMIDDLDFNCGTIVDGEKTLNEVGEEMFDYIVRVASGEKPKGEAMGYGADEFHPWQFGIIS